MSYKAVIAILVALVLGFVLFVCFYINPRITAPVDFVAEKVIMNVVKTDDGFNLEIQGYFIFENSNPFNITRMIEFPVYTDIGILIPESVLVTDANKNSGGDWEITRGRNTYPHTIMPMGSSFAYRFKFPKMRSKIMACRYSHKLNGNEIGYIVTTIRAWEKPLKKGRFEIYLPGGYELVESNYDFKLTEIPAPDTGKTRQVWRFDVEDFFPDKDIEAKFDLIQTDNELGNE
ncbi:hypothetical protein J7L05_06650 [bacterium]|nr:hypothetical protein [bacterium]